MPVVMGQFSVSRRSRMDNIIIRRRIKDLDVFFEDSRKRFRERMIIICAIMIGKDCLMLFSAISMFQRGNVPHRATGR